MVGMTVCNEQIDRKTAGERVTDEGDGGTKVAEYLVSQKII